VHLIDYHPLLLHSVTAMEKKFAELAKKAPR
jgi:hypothetical protein